MMNINLNQARCGMNKYELVACDMLWAEKHSTLCNMFDALSRLAALNPDNGEFTAHDIGASGSTLMRIMNTNGRANLLPFVVARRVPCKVKIPTWVWDEQIEKFGGIMGEGHTEYKEVDKEMNVYRLQWSADELHEFVEAVSKMARVIV